MTGQIPNPYLVGASGPHALLPARVCRVLEVKLGTELSSLRISSRGVDQETAYALMAVSIASASYVPPEEHEMAFTSEQAAESRSEWLSTAEAAEVLQIGKRAVVAAIARNRLPACRVGTAWRIRSTDVTTYKNSRAAEGTRCQR